MPDESVIVEEGAPSSQGHFWHSSWRKVTLWLLISLGISVFFFLRPLPWASHEPNTQSIEALKSQIMALSHRVAQLEDGQKTPSSVSLDPEQMKDMDGRITALRQQVENIQNQPKAEPSFQRPEQLLALQEEVRTLRNTQRIVKSTLLFARLKAKALSEAPYARELADFKKAANEPEKLKILEKYADAGLQSLKEAPQGIFPLSSNEKEQGFWGERLKEMLNSLVKVEKVDGPLPSSSSRERQAVEDALSQIDQTLAQHLTVAPPSLSFSEGAS